MSGILFELTIFVLAYPTDTLHLVAPAYRDALTDPEYEVHKMLGYPRPSKSESFGVHLIDY
jgi:hypothetical protein